MFKSVIYHVFIFFWVFNIVEIKFTKKIMVIILVLTNTDTRNYFLKRIKHRIVEILQFPIRGTGNKIYVVLKLNKIYEIC